MLTAVESAKQIRIQLKAAFPGTKFWVTSKNAIRIIWIDGPTKEAVETIANQHQKINRCEATGEILSGGNSFVFCDRMYSEQSLREAIAVIQSKNYAVWSHIDWDGVTFKPEFDGKGDWLVYKKEYTAYDGYRRDLGDDIRDVLRLLDLSNGFPESEPEQVSEVTITAQETLAEVIEEPETLEVEGHEIDERVKEVLDIRAERFNGRKENRIERFNELAEKHSKLSTEAYNQSHRMGSVIPMGQPILVGHYSEGRDRRYRDKIWNKMGQSVKHDKTAQYYAGKAEAAEQNKAIRSDDPEAIAKLKAEISELEALQESMKAANKIVKSQKLSTEEKAKQLKASGYSVDLLAPDYCGRTGYAGFQLSNNNANIRRLKQRLTELEASLAVAAELGDTEEEFPQYGLVVIHARSINRLQLKFEGKPSEEVRSILKSNGFRWAPSEMAWQRFLSNSKYALERTIETLETVSSKSVMCG